MSTLGVMVDKVQRELQEQSANMFNEGDIKQAIGDAYGFYSFAMINEGAGWFATTANLAIIAATETVSVASLTPPFISLIMVEKNFSTGTKPLKTNQGRWNFKSSIGVGAGESYMPEYYMRGQNIVLVPTPVTAEAASTTTGLKAHYNYQPTLPTGDSADSFSFDANFPLNWERLVVLRAMITVLRQKDQIGAMSDPDLVYKELGEWEELLYNSLERDETPEEAEYIGNDY